MGRLYYYSVIPASWRSHAHAWTAGIRPASYGNSNAVLGLKNLLAKSETWTDPGLRRDDVYEGGS